MYAVFSDGAIVYLGDDRTDAMKTLESKVGATLSQVNTLASLSGAFSTYKETFSEDFDKDDYDPQPESESPADPLQDASDAMERILEKLDEAGFNPENTEELCGQLRERAEDAVAEVKSLGIKSMAVVGKGFVAIGDLLTAMEKTEDDKEGDAEDESEEPVID